MESKEEYIEREFHVKNMNSLCCFRLIRLEFEAEEIQVLSLRTGFMKLRYNTVRVTEKTIDTILQKAGMCILSNPELIVLEKIKQTVIEQIHYMNNVNSIAQKSDYLVEKLRMSYRHISGIFRKYEPLTLERFIILHKIERVKELLDSEEYSLSEIAYMMDYNSVQYLSALFKKEVGVSVSEYKKSPAQYKKRLDSLY